MRLVSLLLLGLCLLVGLGPAPAHGAPVEPFDTERPAWDSLSVFTQRAREVLGPRLQITDSIDYDELKPEDALLLVHPIGSLDLASLSRFLHAGGRLVLLDDFGDGDRLLSHFGMVRRPLREPSQTLGNVAHLPVARPASLHPTVAEVEQVVLNQASCIEHPDLSVVLDVELRSGERRAVAVAGAVGRGHLLVVSDSSVFVDAMMRFEGNATFATAVVRYAEGDDVWGNRGGRVFLLREKIEQRGVFGNASKLAAFLEEAQRSARAAWQQLHDEGLSGVPAFGLGLLAALACVWWVAKRAARVHVPHLPRYVEAPSALAQGGGLGHVQLLLAPSTPRALALLEQKAAFEERLAQWLGLPEPPPLSDGRRSWLPPQPELLAMLSARGASAAQVAELRALFFRLAQAETWLLSQGRAPKVSEAEVVSLAARLEAVLAALTQSSTPDR